MVALNDLKQTLNAQWISTKNRQLIYKNNEIMFVVMRH